MKAFFNEISEMRSFLLLWLTQTISGLGSAMTAYALVIWSYTQKGSALATALLMVCSYAPYVLFSIFAGALSDRWNKKKIMLGCDALAAFCTLAVLAMLKAGRLQIWHLYVVNAVSGLMNTVQQPASEVATTALLPPKFYQKVGGLRYLGNSLQSIMTPILATAVLGIWGMDAVITIDLVSFSIAFAVLLLCIPIPKIATEGKKENVLNSAAEGISWLRHHAGIFHLMLFLAGINLVASMYNAAFPAMMLSKPGAGETAMGTVNAVVGMSMLAGSMAASLLRPPKSRVKAIWFALMVSMGTENFLLAFGTNVWHWSLAAFLGWITIPWMSTNLDAVNRLNIPVEIQGRVYAARNSFQFFTIPLGYFLGGLLVDRVFEPLMAMQSEGSILITCFGAGKGSGAACFFAALWLLGIGMCLWFRGDREIWKLGQ